MLTLRYIDMYSNKLYAYRNKQTNKQKTKTLFQIATYIHKVHENKECVWNYIHVLAKNSAQIAIFVSSNTTQAQKHMN